MRPSCEDTRQDKAPLYEAMRDLLKRGVLPFSTPGHRQGRGMMPELASLFTPLGASADTSLLEALGTVECPAGALAEAESLAAELYGADAAVFSVNGTTSLLHAMLLSALCPGDTVLLPRNAHRSVVGGLILAGVSPVYMEPAYDRRFGIAHNVAPETVERALAAHPEARAALLVSPTYYGVSCDLKRIAEVVHRKGKLLLVDEAHGAHLAFSDRLPISAMEAGADMAAQSTHKLAGALTQASTLLLRTERMDAARVRRASALLQSTSPNYFLLASLDAARKQLAVEGRARIERAADLSLALRARLAELDGLRVLGASSLDGAGAYALDVMKLTVSVAELGITGGQAADFLREEQGIGAEMADAHNVLFIISYADTEETTERLYQGLRALCRHYAGKRRASSGQEVLERANDAQPIAARAAHPAADAAACIYDIERPPRILAPREAFFAQTEEVGFRAAQGRIAGETLYFYPPGIPLVSAGELLTGDVLDALRRGADAGLPVHGATDASLQKLKVIIHV